MVNDDVVIIVDGYNYLYSIEKNRINKMELEQLRNRLIEDLNQLAKYKDWQVTVVFDSLKGNSILHKNMKVNLVEVLFTKKGQSADDLAESLVYKNKGKKIFVVTSDYTHQRITFGSGAFRMTTKQLKNDLDKLKKEIRDRTAFSSKLNIPISKRIDQKIAKELERLRKGKVEV